MNAALRKKYEAEQARLDDELRELEHHWQTVPRFFAFAAFAPLVTYFYGFAAGMVELMVTLALVGTRAYLIGIRKSENRWTHQSLARELQDTADEEPSRVVARPQSAAVKPVSRAG